MNSVNTNLSANKLNQAATLKASTPNALSSNGFAELLSQQMTAKPETQANAQAPTTQSVKDNDNSTENSFMQLVQKSKKAATGAQTPSESDKNPDKLAEANTTPDASMIATFMPNILITPPIQEAATIPTETDVIASNNTTELSSDNKKLSSDVASQNDIKAEDIPNDKTPVTEQTKFAETVKKAEPVIVAEVQNQTASQMGTNNTIAINNSITPANMLLNNQLAPLNNASPVSIPTPVGHSNWSNDFAQKVTWVNQQGLQSAELHLNPKELGPVDIVLQVSDGQATMAFSSPHHEVRQAIEQALPKLRESLADNGITLGNTTVSDQAPKERGQEFSSKTSSQNNHNEPVREDDNISTLSTTAKVSQHNGLLDTFA